MTTIASDVIWWCGLGGEAPTSAVPAGRAQGRPLALVFDQPSLMSKHADVHAWRVRFPDVPALGFGAHPGWDQVLKCGLDGWNDGHDNLSSLVAATGEIRRRMRKKRSGEPHVLVVDDDQMCREALGLLIKRAGYRVSTASSSNEALHLIRDEPVTVVLTDIIMPGMDGRSLIESISAYDHEIPIAAMSGAGVESSAAHAWLPKPSDASSVLAVIDALTASTTP
jgi:CheY-like chemotaxis protein